MLENKDVEDVATSAEPQNGNVPPQPQLEQANQSLVAQSGAQEYAPHVINTPLAFLIKSALNSNIFGEPGLDGHRLARRTRSAAAMTSVGKPGPPTARRTPGSPGYGPGVVTSVWIGFGRSSSRSWPDHRLRSD
ncbi:multimodular transpeptidase-transglycosylase [Klebsiella pneumoniae subsp. ozaenae]|uniref:Multimodular transpeptidase-transglycosylase n=1 Tax=Klebsiella pneumoniae subsp. ozaenae TaxID=574 RepID=A0A378AKT3_KLEPO|nr:multimodular transpeptidase-transglycosylase [Klebsiella pneumoniae subsp. ozaenae]